MSYGLQVFDSSGGLVVDVIDRLTRIHSVYSVTVPAYTSAFYSVVGATNDGTWAAFVNSIGMFATVSIETGGFRATNRGGASLDMRIVVLRV